MIMQLRWGYVTAAKEILTPQLSLNRTYSAGRPHVGLCPICLVYHRTELSHVSLFSS